MIREMKIITIHETNVHEIYYNPTGIILCMLIICFLKLPFKAKAPSQILQWNFLGTPHSNFKCELKPFLYLYFRPQLLGHIYSEQFLAHTRFKSVTVQVKS